MFNNLASFMIFFYVNNNALSYTHICKILGHDRHMHFFIHLQSTLI